MGDITSLGSDTEGSITPLDRKVLISLSMVSCCSGENLLSRVAACGKHNGSERNSRGPLNIHCKL